MGNSQAEEDPLLEDAARLIPAAKIYAISLSKTLGQKFPFTLSINKEQWDFVFIVASVFLAASRLNNLRVGDEREAKIMDVVSMHLNEWKSDGLRGFDDCKGLFETEYVRLAAAGHEPRFLAADALGIWIVCNLLGHGPKADEECQLVRAAGVLVTKTFFDWWSLLQSGDS